MAPDIATFLPPTMRINRISSTALDHKNRSSTLREREGSEPSVALDVNQRLRLYNAAYDQSRKSSMALRPSDPGANKTERNQLLDQADTVRHM